MNSAPLVKPSNHLPTLYNPLLNCIFNNPYHGQNPFKQTIHELAMAQNEFTVLVPPAFTLNNCYDPATPSASHKVFLKDLCYNSEDFIRSHIIRSSVPSFNSATNQKNQLIMYYTMNGKQILVKNSMIFTGRGFKRSLRLRILGYGQFDSFSDYFPKNSKFTLMYIEDTLIGSNFMDMAEYINPELLPSTTYDRSNSITEDGSKPRTKDPITFEMILRSVPLLSKLVSESYYKLFHHNNRDYAGLRNQTRKPLETIKADFDKMIEEAFSIILDGIKADNPEAERTSHIIKDLLDKNPELDLNNLVYEYVEISMYDKIWSQLMFQFNYPNDDFDREAIKHLTHDKYSKLSCLSLNQLEIPLEEPWHINTILRRITLAIDEFSKLSDASVMSLSAKKAIITKAVTFLTGDEENGDAVITEKDSQLLIDADTLVGMLIMVVVHSKVPDLEAHLYYIKNFSIETSTDGYFNYILSNLDAVIFHLATPDDGSDSHLQELMRSSQDTYSFWSLIQKKDTESLSEILQDANKEFPTELPVKHFIKSRNINGESCLMFAIKTRDRNVFELLLDFNIQWFSTEDILFDKNTTTGQNLLTVSLITEASEISSIIVDIILESFDKAEQIAYINLVDLSGRSAGHYLFHDIETMKRIGHLVDWELRENGQTPLFSLCRCYDHSNYIEIIQEGFKCVYSKTGKPIDFNKHKDKNNNTLLHVILKGLKESKLLDQPIDVNSYNNKSMSPLIAYVKYSRVSNLEEILKCKGLKFLAEEPKNFYNVFDYLSFLAGKSTAHSKEFKKIESLIYNYAFENYIPQNDAIKIIASNARFDMKSKDWAIFFRVKEKDHEATIFETLDNLKHIVQVFELKHPFIALPNKDSLWNNYKMDKQTVPGYSKYRINRLLEVINLYLLSLGIYSTETQKSFLREFTYNETKKQLAFEVMREVSKGQDTVKKSLGEVIVSNTQIDEIESFLNYSLNDLNLYKKVVSRLNKILSVYQVKEVDLRIVYDRSVAKLASNDMVNRNIQFEYYGDEKQDGGAAYGTLLKFTGWIELSLIELIININKVLHKLDSWRVIYERIKNVNNELKRYENKVHAHDVSHDVAANEEQPSSPQKSDLVVTSLFSFGIENKKSRYRRLLLVKAEEVKSIMALNSEIKLQHESIALEISRLLKSKSNFLGFAFESFTKDLLTSLKQRHRELERLRDSL